MRPIKFNTGASTDTPIWNDGFLHAIIPDVRTGANAVVEFVKTGKVTTVRVEDIQFDPTTESLMRQQAEAQRRQEQMMARMGMMEGDNRILVPR